MVVMLMIYHPYECQVWKVMESEKHSLDDVETNLLRKGGIEWMIEFFFTIDAGIYRNIAA